MAVGRHGFSNLRDSYAPGLMALANLAGAYLLDRKRIWRRGEEQSAQLIVLI